MKKPPTAAKVAADKSARARRSRLRVWKAKTGALEKRNRDLQLQVQGLTKRLEVQNRLFAELTKQRSEQPQETLLNDFARVLRDIAFGDGAPGSKIAAIKEYLRSFSHGFHPNGTIQGSNTRGIKFTWQSSNMENLPPPEPELRLLIKPSPSYPPVTPPAKSGDPSTAAASGSESLWPIAVPEKPWRSSTS